MAAGDLITGDWEIELRGVLMGGDTDYPIDRSRGSIGGLLDDLIDIIETPFAHASGSFVGQSRSAARTATFAIEMCGTAVESGDGLEVMRTVWASSSEAIPLYFQVPGFGKQYVNGWPGGIVVEYTTPDFGVIPIIASFRITDPTIYT